MISNLIEIFKGWNQFLQFFFLMLNSYFILYVICDVVNKILDFINDGLVILIRGWAPGMENLTMNQGQTENDTSEKSEKDDNK